MEKCNQIRAKNNKFPPRTMLTHPSRNNNIQFNTYNMKLVSSFNYFNCHYATDLRELIVLLLCRIFFLLLESTGEAFSCKLSLIHCCRFYLTSCRRSFFKQKINWSGSVYMAEADIDTEEY